jgi:hypothetical protein
MKRTVESSKSVVLLLESVLFNHRLSGLNTKRPPSLRVFLHDFHQASTKLSIPMGWNFTANHHKDLMKENGGTGLRLPPHFILPKKVY